MTAERDRLDRFVLASVFLHAGLVTLVVLSPKLLPSFGPNWGSNTGSADAGIKVKIAGSSSAIPLPTPEVVTENAPANDNPGFYKNEEPPAPPPPPPTKNAEPIPETTPIKPPPPAPKPRPAPPAPKSTAPPDKPPENAVPSPGPGRPSMSYGQFSTGAGEAGIGFGDAAFGERYGAYVNAITRAISSNWLKSLVDARVPKAPRVYLTFEIAKNGKISNVGVQQSSGIPSLDRSAQRAVLASDPLPPLPTDFRGSSVNVNFYFEYSR
jgi:periplasmic protein TonB